MNSVRAAEAVRLSMGLMTYLDEIGILFTGDAVWAVAGLKPESGTVMADSLGQLEKFLSYGQEVLADGFSCKTRSVTPVLEGIETVDRKKAADIINNAKYVITI